MWQDKSDELTPLHLFPGWVKAFTGASRSARSRCTDKFALSVLLNRSLEIYINLRTKTHTPKSCANLQAYINILNETHFLPGTRLRYSSRYNGKLITFPHRERKGCRRMGLGNIFLVSTDWKLMFQSSIRPNVIYHPIAPLKSRGENCILYVLTFPRSHLIFWCHLTREKSVWVSFSPFF